MDQLTGSSPWIKTISPEISPPSLKDNTADVDRLLKEIKKSLQTESVSMDLSFAKRFPHDLRKYHYRVDATVFEDKNGWHLIDIFPLNKGNCLHGLAVDLGSSTVVVRIVDLASLKTEGEASFHNPQVEIGTDILTRIHFAAQEGGLERLQTLLVERLNRDQIPVIRDKITYLELNVNQEFMNLFSAAKFIPHTDRSLFPSVKPITS